MNSGTRKIAKLTDFGLARFTAGDELTGETVTRVGVSFCEKKN